MALNEHMLKALTEVRAIARLSAPIVASCPDGCGSVNVAAGELWPAYCECGKQLKEEAWLKAA